MKRIIFISIFIYSLSFDTLAQQDPMFTQFFCNTLTQNPAYAGSRDAINFMGLYRNQWVGFDGAPKTYLFSVHSPILRQKSGVGLTLMRDKIGITDNFMAKIAYSYRIDFGAGRLAFGINGHFHRLQMHWKETNPIAQLDNFIPYTDSDLFLMNFGTGVYWDTKKYYIGVSVPKLLENKMSFQDNSSQVSTAKLQRHYFLMGGAIFPINEYLKLKPATLIKYVQNAPLEVDLNVSLLIMETLLIGTTFRTNDSFDFIAQFRFKNYLCIGYAHDFTFTKLNLHHKGTHEILISFDIAKKPQGFDHPRYF